MNKPTGGRAFPAFVPADNNGQPMRPSEIDYLGVGGMTYRQWLIGQALAGAMSGPGAAAPSQAANRAVAAADAALSYEEATR
jgi:hypothetical protein